MTGPLQSPEPDAPEVKRSSTGVSGVWAAVDTFNLKAAVNLTISLAALIAALGAIFGGYLHILNEAKAQSDAGIALNVPPLEKRLVVVEQSTKQLKEDVHETQVDIRALYKAVMTGQKQDRLEVPPVTSDAGH